MCGSSRRLECAWWIPSKPILGGFMEWRFKEVLQLRLAFLRLQSSFCAAETKAVEIKVNGWGDGEEKDPWSSEYRRRRNG